MRKEKEHSQQEYRDKNLAKMKKRVSEEVSQGLDLSTSGPILKALADNHRMEIKSENNAVNLTETTGTV
jgi:hypothetical protein